MIVGGKSIEQTARETNHAPETITRYIKGYKSILACLSQDLTPKDTAFVAQVSENLVDEYMTLADENQLDIKEQKGIYEDVNLDDFPF